MIMCHNYHNLDGVMRPATALLMWCHLYNLYGVGYIFIYEHGVEKRGKDISMGSSSVQEHSAGHNTVYVDNLVSPQKKVNNPVTHRCV